MIAYLLCRVQVLLPESHTAVDIFARECRPHPVSCGADESCLKISDP